MDLGKEINQEQIIQVIHYLAVRIRPLYKTQLIKLLYLLDELSVKTVGYPVTWLEYEVWKNGPVSKWLYYEVKDNCGQSLMPVLVTLDHGDKVEFIAQGESDTDLLSQFDITLLNQIIEDYGHMTGAQLINVVHQPECLWSKIAIENGLTELWKRDISTSHLGPFKMDFRVLIEDDPFKLDVYEAVKESLEFSLALR